MQNRYITIFAILATSIISSPIGAETLDLSKIKNAYSNGNDGKATCYTNKDEHASTEATLSDNCDASNLKLNEPLMLSEKMK